MKNLRVSIIGCGAIGTEIAKAINGTKEVRLTAVVDVDRQKAEKVAALSTDKPRITDIDGAIRLSDLVLESAFKTVVPVIVKKAIKMKKDIMIMSEGGLIEHLELIEMARKKNVCIYLPSGALAGIDGVKSAMAGKVYSVTLTTSKPPIALKGAPYLDKKKIDIMGIKKKTVIFEGSAREAVAGFPANVNVAFCLSFAGFGFDKTKVKLIADPALKINMHEIEIEGEFGRIYTRTENVPSPANPKTSYLAALSAVATFKRILDPIKIGT
jgi:aspartate dehydrogenase